MRPPAWRRRATASSSAVALLLPSLAQHDAVGHDTLGLREALCARGLGVRVFAGSSAVQRDAEGLDAAARFLPRAALVLYQQSTGWAEGVRLLNGVPGRVLIRDHGITPSRFFSESDAALRNEVSAGEEQRAALASNPRITGFLATSPVVVSELVELGAPPERIRIVPPFTRIEALADLAPDESTLRRYLSRPADVLFVGRIAPNKGQHRIQRVIARYAALFGEPLRVRLVGKVDPRHGAYEQLLRRERSELALEGRVQVLGEVGEPALKAIYLTSRVFLCCSEHEGFCVPVVEASWLGLPVVATHQSAVADTLGPQGLVLPPDADDDLVAVALRRILHDAALRERLVEAQRSSVRLRFTRDAIGRALGAALDELGT